MDNTLSIPLCEVPTGMTARVKDLSCAGNARRRMLDLGLIMDTVVHVLQRSPFGDPTAYFIRGAVIALRSDEAKTILVHVD